MLKNLATKSSSKADILPYSLRAFFAIVLFTEAALLAYKLAISFPRETTTALAIVCLTVALKYLTLRIKPDEDFRNLTRLLDRLKKETSLGQNLKLKWVPNGSQKLCGEVIGDTIYVYEANLEKAKATLIEEFVEYAIAESHQPYINILNAIIKELNDEAYRKRHRVAQAITKILKKAINPKTKTTRK